MQTELNDNNTKKVYTETIDFSLREIKEMFDNGEIEPQPDYQRDYIMDDSKASKLIESTLLKIPIPTVYLCEEQGGEFSIIDGQQRLTSFVRFLKNEFKLKGLEQYPELNGKYFKEIGKNLQQVINTTKIHTIEILKESQELKYEIFARLNQGSTSLKPQELRNCIYRGSFNQMLENIASTNTNLPILFCTENRRKNYQELILRYFAMKNFQNYGNSLTKTLNNYMAKHQNESKEELQKMKLEFNSKIEIIKQYIGNDAFCAYDRSKGVISNKFSGSVYDSIVIGFSMFNNNDIIAHGDEIRTQLMLMKTTDEKYMEDTYVATGTKASVVGRIMSVYELLSRIIGKKGDYNVQRTYSRQIKEKLWHENYKCSYCGNIILTIDDAETDHVVAFANGGQTIIENAQLLHRHCNREKNAQEIDQELDL